MHKYSSREHCCAACICIWQPLQASLKKACTAYVTNMLITIHIPRTMPSETAPNTSANGTGILLDAYVAR